MFCVTIGYFNKNISKIQDNFFVKLHPVILSAFISIFLLTGFVIHAYAVQMEVFLIPERDRADASYTGTRFITIKYEPGSALAQQFAGTNERITFTINASNAGMDGLISTINNDLFNVQQSTAKIEELSIVYTASLKGDQDDLTISYKVGLRPTISGFVLEQSGEQGTIMDLNWRGLEVQDPLTVQTTEYGNMSINHPIGAIQAVYPEFAEQLLNSEAKPLLTQPLLNFEEIGAPMDRWHFLFDPTGSQAAASGQGYLEEGGARVVSVYSLGESSFREGTHSTKESSATATLDGQKISIKSSTPPPSAQIQIAGFSRIEKAGNEELAFVTVQAPEGTVTATGGFPIQVLLVLGGMMGAVAVFVLVKARK